MRMSESIKEITVALIAAQGGLPKLSKDKINPFFKHGYVGLETVMPEALAILNKNGMALTQTVGTAEGGGTTLSTTILHSSGEWISDTQPLLLVKPDPQGQGSAITYGRRYAVMAMLGLVADDDDDGAAASPRDAAPQSRPQPRQQRQEPVSAAPPIDAHERKVRELEEGEQADGAQLMILKFDGECLGCGQPISKGTNAFYSYEKKAVWHERCGHLLVEVAGEPQRKLEPVGADPEGDA